MSISAPTFCEYTFYFSIVYFDEFIRLKYLISPSLLEKNGEDRFMIWAEVQDDIGSQYFSGGGAYSLWKFAPYTDGTLTFSPLPPEGSELLSFTINVRQGDESGEFSFSLLLDA